MKKLFLILLVLMILTGCSYILGTGEGLVTVIIQKDGTGAFSSGIFYVNLEPVSGTAGETRQKVAALPGYEYQTITAFSGLENGSWTLSIDAYSASDLDNMIFNEELAGSIIISDPTPQVLRLTINYNVSTETFFGVYDWP